MIHDNIANFVTIKTEVGEFCEFNVADLETAGGFSSTSSDAPLPLALLLSPTFNLDNCGELYASDWSSDTNSSKQEKVSRQSLTLATGRRDLKSERVSPEEARRRAARRESNRRAATKCRLRRQMCISTLETEIVKLEDDRKASEDEIEELQAEMYHLQQLLEHHKVNCSKSVDDQTQHDAAKRPDSLQIKPIRNDFLYLEEVMNCTIESPLLGMLETPKNILTSMDLDSFNWMTFNKSV